MSVSVSESSVAAAAATPSVPPRLAAFAPLPTPVRECPRRVRQRLDLLLLAIECLDLGGPEAIHWISRELGLDSILQGRVQVWQLRSTNPLRRNTRRQPMTLEEGQALATVIATLAQRLAVPLRQALLSLQRLRSQELPVSSDPQLAFYLERFRRHFRARMNPARAAVMALREEEAMEAIALELLQALLFCTGTAGPQRLWAGLFDGEL